MKIAQEEYDYLSMLHQLFKTSKEGAQILKTWEHFTFYEPGIHKGDPEYMIYIREGEKLFVRKILIALQRFENLPVGENLEIVAAKDLTPPADNINP